jgi:uncharacterized repeat protein (TIGR01451 family)
MKNIKKAAFAVIGAVSLILPMGLGAVAHAEQVQLIDISDSIPNSVQCVVPDGEFSQRGVTDGCDLGVDKQVSVNGGAYAEADTSADAAQAQVGDTVTWQITVSNTSDSEDMSPYGKVTVHDVLPSGAAFDSYVASSGTYASNDWTFSLFGNLPATLTITSHAVATGLFQNTAAFSAYDPCLDGCLGAGAYSDSNPDNNSNDAWMDPSAGPAVLAASTTLTNTGSGTNASLMAGGLIVLTLVVLAVASRQKRYEA